MHLCVFSVAFLYQEVRLHSTGGPFGPSPSSMAPFSVPQDQCSPTLWNCEPLCSLELPLLLLLSQPWGQGIKRDGYSLLYHYIPIIYTGLSLNFPTAQLRYHCNISQNLSKDLEIKGEELNIEKVKRNYWVILRDHRCKFLHLSPQLALLGLLSRLGNSGRGLPHLPLFSSGFV